MLLNVKIKLTFIDYDILDKSTNHHGQIPKPTPRES